MPKCFLSATVAFISTLLDLYYTRALELLKPDVIGLQLFPPRGMMACFIFFNYGKIICYSHSLWVFVRPSLYLSAFCLPKCAFQSLKYLEFIQTIIFANLQSEIWHGNTISNTDI